MRGVSNDTLAAPDALALGAVRADEGALLRDRLGDSAPVLLLIALHVDHCFWSSDSSTEDASSRIALKFVPI